MATSCEISPECISPEWVSPPRLPTPDSRLPIPDSRFPRCAFRRRIKFATGRTAPDSRLPTP
ncbi:MAG: hypothetical protein F6J98_41420 [Moorea sp. SIO4G2]|nr:hypothetical protein [Moorena sp. SIO4G2]